MGAAASTTQGKGQGVVQPSTPTLAQPGQVSTQQPQTGGLGMGGVAGKGNAPVQPTVQPTVPPQGGKAPLTLEQQVALEPYINPARPMPVQQPIPAQGGKARAPSVPSVTPRIQGVAPINPAQTRLGLSALQANLAKARGGR